jgi:hypothetical protein
MRFDIYNVGDPLSKDYTDELFKIINFNTLKDNVLYYRSCKLINFITCIRFRPNETNRSRLRKMRKIAECVHFVEWLPDNNTLRKIKLITLNYGRK